MGNKCHCCPLFHRHSSDQDSIQKQSHLAVDGELEPVPHKKKTMQKKVNKNIEFQLQRQQSRFFQNNPAVENLLQKQQVPLISASRKELTPLSNQEHFSYYSKIKQTIKPQINKISTVDDDQNMGQYYVTSAFSENEDQSQVDISSKFQEKKINLTFSHPPPPLILEDQYRTVHHPSASRQKRTKAQLESLEHQALSEVAEEKDLYQCYLELAIIKIEEKDLEGSQNYMQKVLQIIQGSTLYQKNHFKPYVLAGSIFLLQGNTSQALNYLLKALRLQISENGTNSIRLIQAYYWLGQTYNRLQKNILSKQYYTKSFRLYNKFELHEPKLLTSLCFQLGKANFHQEEYAEADRFFEKAAKEAEQSDEISTYVQIQLKSAQNQLKMDNYKQSLFKYKKVFKILKIYSEEHNPLYAQALKSLSTTIKEIYHLNISDSELRVIIHIIEEISPDMSELSLLKEHLQKAT